MSSWQVIDIIVEKLISDLSLLNKMFVFSFFSKKRKINNIVKIKRRIEKKPIISIPLIDIYNKFEKIANGLYNISGTEEQINGRILRRHSTLIRVDKFISNLLLGEVIKIIQGVIGHEDYLIKIKNEKEKTHFTREEFQQKLTTMPSVRELESEWIFGVYGRSKIEIYLKKDTSDKLEIYKICSRLEMELLDTKLKIHKWIVR